MSRYHHLRFEPPSKLASDPVWPSGFRLAPFTPDRAREMHSLFAEAYRHGGGSVGPFEDWWQATRSDSEFDPALCFLVEDADARLAAAALCWTSAFVKDIAVREDCRRHGLGRALLTHIAATFHARGFHAIELKVEKDNPSGAVAFYQRFGFMPKGEAGWD
ncbi:GNAT family N-acetyltransferase [Radicibacter daui]|uniref:GNAT family N-acetyltransferase n=1 Tax=Radicibacter daui TaxID=3064829 RepID=UPI004046CBCA